MKTPNEINNKLSQWNNGEGINPSDWICCIGRYDHFIGYTQLIWPEFIEHEGRVYIKDFFNEEKLLQNIDNGASITQAQILLNCLDLSLLFDSAQEDVEDDTLLYLAKTLQESWLAKLNLNFPNKKHNVILDNNLNEEGVGEILLSFSNQA